MIEYKIFDTRQKGVPLGEGNNHCERLGSGLNRLGTEGWTLQTVLGEGHLIIFTREVKSSAPAPLPESIGLKDLYRLHELEHILWGKAHDAPDYDKSLWNEIDRLIGRVGRRIAGDGWLVKAQEAVKREAP